MRLRAALPAVLICWSGCSAPADDPARVLERYFAAARADDWEAFYQFVSSEYRAGRTPQEFRTWAAAATPPFVAALTERTSYTVESVRIDGDRAVVEVDLQVPDLQAIPGLKDRFPTEEEVLAAPLHAVDQTFELVREEGEWRVKLAPPPPPDRDVIDQVERATAVPLPPDPAAGTPAAR